MDESTIRIPERAARALRRPLVRYLRLLGCDAARAEDLAQEAFVALLDGPFEYRGEAPALAWLRETARRKFLAGLREDARRRAEAWTDAADRVWDRLAGESGGDHLPALRACLADLPAADRRLLEEKYVEGRSRAAIAAATGKTEKAVKGRLERVRNRLRECVKRRLRP